MYALRGDVALRLADDREPGLLGPFEWNDLRLRHHRSSELVRYGEHDFTASAGVEQDLVISKQS
jgi:hypothetical protein